MFVAEKLRQSNIAEYLLYMWQVEDLMRVFDVDFDKVKEAYLSRYKDLDDEKREKLEQWYSDILSMMRSERVVIKGHLQICKNVLIRLKDLHESLLASSKYPYYRIAYQDALPSIVELRQKGGDGKENELETCFNFLYGIMLLRLQHKEILETTQTSLKKISIFIGMLSDYYKKDREEPLEF